MLKKLLLFSAIMFLSSFGLAQAQVVINEIAWKGMPTGGTHEWIELRNGGISEVDISAWVLKDINDQLLITFPANSSISAGGFYLIKRTTSTVTPYQLSVAFNGGLSDSGEHLILENNSGTQIDTVNFSSGWPDIEMTAENTMQWNGSSWVTATPTPGALNEQATVPPPTSSSGGGGGSSSTVSSSNTTTTKIPEPQKIRTQIVGKSLAFVGQSASFEGLAFGTSGEKLFNGRYFWNFGDGDSKEVKNNESPKLSHTYFYPGEYTVSLEFYLNYYGDTPDATTQVNIKVVSADIIISNVGNEADFFIELSNNTTYDTDISKWSLSGFNRLFSFPKNTILGAKKKIIFSSKVTGFMPEDKDSLKLLDSQGQILFDYGASLVPAQVIPPVVEKVPSTRRRNASLPVVELTKEGPTQVEVPPESISANVLASNIEENATKNSLLPIIAFSVLLMLSAGVIYIIRQDKSAQVSGDDFEIKN